MDDKLAQVWLASTAEKHLSRTDVDGLNVNAAASALRRPKETPMPLRVEGQLVYGLSHILSRKARYLLRDSTATDKNLADAFKKLVVRQGDAGETSIMVDLGDMDLPDASLMGSHARTRTRAHHRARDMSIDDVMRDDDAPNLSTQPPEEAEPRSEGDMQVLSGLQLDNDDFGPDLTAGQLGSSSPPHEANTPADLGPQEYEGGDFGGEDFGGEDFGGEDFGGDDFGDDLSVVDLGDTSTIIRPQRRRKRGALVDEIIEIVRPSRPPRQILRPELNFDLTSAAPATAPPDKIALNIEVERYLDPVFVAEEMKRRRVGTQIHSSTDGDDHREVIDNDADGNDFGGDDFGGDDFGGDDFGGEDFGGDDATNENENFGESRPVSQATQEANDEDDAEQAERDAHIARRAIESALESHPSGCAFQEIPGTFNSRTRAAAFVELLGLAARGQVSVRQSTAYGAINISA